MTTAEFAELIRAPLETVRYWRYVGKGPRSFKVGRRVLYAADDVETWLANAREYGSGGRALGPCTNTPDKQTVAKTEGSATTIRDSRAKTCLPVTAGDQTALPHALSHSCDGAP